MLLVVYIDTLYHNVQNFTANMDVVLAKLSCQALPCVIAGDLNIDLCKCSVNNDVPAYVDNLVSNNFMPVILMPTRITARSATLIDHMYYLESTIHYPLTLSEKHVVACTQSN